MTVLRLDVVPARFASCRDDTCAVVPRAARNAEIALLRARGERLLRLIEYRSAYDGERFLTNDDDLRLMPLVALLVADLRGGVLLQRLRQVDELPIFAAGMLVFIQEPSELIGVLSPAAHNRDRHRRITLPMGTRHHELAITDGATHDR